MRPNLDLDTLRTFAIGFELGSFARAAERIGRSPSAVSTQLRRLEDQVGRPLVQKSGRGLVPTEAGEKLLSYARRILDLNDEALASLRGIEMEGWVRLGLPQDFAESWLPNVLGGFARSHPKVKIEVRAEKTGLLVDRTCRGELDLCLHWGSVAGIANVETVADVPMVWIGRGDHVVSPPDRGERLPLVTFEAPCSFRDPAINELDRAGMDWRLAFTSPSLSALWAATAAGLGITMRTMIGLPRDLVVLDPVATGLPPLPQARLTLVQAEREQSAPVKALRDLLVRSVHAGPRPIPEDQSFDLLEAMI